MHHDQIKALVTKALQYGGKRKTAIRTEWDMAGSCSSPVVHEIHVRPGASEHVQDDADKFITQVMRVFPGAEVVRDLRPVDQRPQREKYIVVSRQSAFPLTLTMTMRCRKCDRCLAVRAAEWRHRAKVETAQARRTWFGTLTLRPESHVTMVNRARVALSKQGLDFDALNLKEQFSERVKQCSYELTKYLKRVRKESGGILRYLLVAEHHKSGLPHFHMLVHELDDEGVRHATLSTKWQLGFEKWRLVTDPREATYLCKYLSKTSAARVRASRSYGTVSTIAAAGGVRKSTPQNANDNVRGIGAF